MVACASISLLILSAKAVAEAPTYKVPQTLEGKIEFYSEMYRVSPQTVSRVVYCESRNNPLAHNLTKREDSWGLVQINRLAHPDISVEEATDPDFAINFLAKNLSLGNGNMWYTCYRQAIGIR